MTLVYNFANKCAQKNNCFCIKFLHIRTSQKTQATMFLNVCMFVCLHAPYVQAQNEKNQTAKAKRKTPKINILCTVVCSL